MKVLIAKVVATALGSGFSPIAPGTAGAIVGVAAWYLIYQYVGFSEEEFTMCMLGLTIIFFFIGVWATYILEPEWGHDPGKIVIDEVIGVWIALLFIPFSFTNLLLGFVLFRFFDILKPLLIKKLEALPSGWGVMGDDVLAGVYANIVLQIIVWSKIF